MNKYWNVIASLTVILIVLYTGACTTALVMGLTTFDEFKQAVFPLVTAVVGYLAAMLPKQTEAQ